MNCAGVQDTSEYWRKLLKLDEGPSPAQIKEDSSVLKFARSSLRSALQRIFADRFALTSYGTEDLPKGVPYLISSNHSSYLDFLAVFFCLPEEDRDKMSAVYKMLYYRILPVRFLINLFVRAVPVDSNNYLGSLSKAAGLLRSGYCMYISPEGTRSKTGELLPFKVGVGALAIETQTPVVPAYIDGAYKAMPKGRFFPGKNKITVKFGKPIYLKEFIEKKSRTPAYDVYREVTERLKQEIVSLGAKV